MKKSGIKIREARKKDIPQMMKIIKINFPRYSKDLAFKELNDMFSNSLYKPTYVVAVEKGNIIGFNGYIVSWVDNLVVDIFWVNTHPDFYGKGIQSTLMKETIRRIKDIRNPKMKLILISTAIPTFFQKFGFRKIGTKYDGKYILMEKRL